MAHFPSQTLRLDEALLHGVPSSGEPPATDSLTHYAGCVPFWAAVYSTANVPMPAELITVFGLHNLTEASILCWHVALTAYQSRVSTGNAITSCFYDAYRRTMIRT